MHAGESMDMESCVHACGAEVYERPCGVSWGMHECPGRHPSLLESCGEGWISLPPPKHLLTQIIEIFHAGTHECPFFANFKSPFPDSMNGITIAKLETWEPFMTSSLLSITKS